MWHRVHTVPTLTLLKVWASAQEVGLTPGSLLKWLLVKFNRVIIPVTSGLPLYFLSAAPLCFSLFIFCFSLLASCCAVLFRVLSPVSSFIFSSSVLFFCLFRQAFLEPFFISIFCVYFSVCALLRAENVHIYNLWEVTQKCGLFRGKAPTAAENFSLWSPPWWKRQIRIQQSSDHFFGEAKQGQKLFAEKADTDA